MSVTDEQILAGFANLHQVITTGFDAVRAEMAAMRAELCTEFRGELGSRLGAFENRMMRRFDQIDARFDRLEARVDDHERRISTLETP
ncbi:MAG TPA: hypothetical protein VMD91_18550 [Candidatus Sulfotelmatobacter sp.]|nr:hypothetical protein [Candidatus Sulfotelmatobacter sp.]